MTGTTKPFGVSAANPIWKYSFKITASPVSASIEELKSGKFFQCGHACLDQEREHRQLEAALLVLFVQLHTKSFELGDIGVVVIGDMRDRHPVARQRRARRCGGCATFQRA